jgi:3-oxoacyl-[acyl-carrier protein] reductase
MSTAITSSHGNAGGATVSRGRDFGVRDRVVVITGAGQGIGRVTPLRRRHCRGMT